MQYEIKAPSVLHHTAKLPASKSISNRVLVIHALTGGHTLPSNLSDCDDTEVIVEALNNNRAVWVLTSSMSEKRAIPHSASRAAHWRAVCWRWQETSVRNTYRLCC